MPRMMLTKIVKCILTRENVFALAFCVILILLVIMTTNTAPQWIYQGF